VQSFGQLLAGTLAAKRLNQKQFAALVKIHPTLVGKIIKGSRSPNWKRAHLWVAALGLRGAEAEGFMDAMALAASPPRVRAMVARLVRNRTILSTDGVEDR
jgi:hypothetical protein